MSVNPNLIPWMTLMGLLSMGLAYGAGRILGVADPLNLAFYGLSVGVFVGLIIQMVFRSRARRQRAASDQGASEGTENKSETVS